jgi:hypothetical protein
VTAIAPCVLSRLFSSDYINPPYDCPAGETEHHTPLELLEESFNVSQALFVVFSTFLAFLLGRLGASALDSRPSSAAGKQSRWWWWWCLPCETGRRSSADGNDSGVTEPLLASSSADCDGSSGGF